ncbi:MAG: hypothetical protein PF440_03865 [Thiomicrorhabdus sp.]|jgi:hypothetical protein|nr:hypothetical protein [Thiomicrorhabdus sp.]
MSQIYIPLIAALAGTIIGSAASIITILIQSKSQEKRDDYKLAIEAAIEDHKAAIELSKQLKKGTILPLTSFIYFHVKYMKLIKKGDLSPESLASLREEQKGLWA